MRWYETAVAAPDAKASMKAAEQLANVRGRLGWEIVERATRHLDDMKKRREGRRVERARPEPLRGVRAWTRERSLRQAVTRADRLIDAVARTAREAESPSNRRWSGPASSGRRTSAGRSSTESRGRRARVGQDLRQMRAAYEDAQEIGREDAARRTSTIPSRIVLPPMWRVHAGNAAVAQSRSEDGQHAPKEPSGQERHRPGLLERRRRNRTGSVRGAGGAEAGVRPQAAVDRPTRICTSA